MNREITAVAVATSLLIGCVGPFSENFESHYATVAEASEGRYKGWIPEGLLPEDAVDIWEYHNIDSNATWGCFRLPGGADELRVNLLRIGALRTSAPLGAGPRKFFVRREWWPEAVGSDETETYQYRESPRFGVTVGILPGGAAACFRRWNR